MFLYAMTYKSDKSAIKRLNAYNMKKQTAVEWLFEQFFKVKWDSMQGNRPTIFEQAKDMEKEQHEETALSMSEILLDKLEGKNNLPSKELFEQYYNETYEKDA